MSAVSDDASSMPVPVRAIAGATPAASQAVAAATRVIAPIDGGTGTVLGSLRARVAGRAATTFAALQVRDYRLLFQGNAVTSVGFWMQQAALGWLVLELTNSPFYLGLASFARSFPMLMVSPFGGIIADRLDRRLIIVSTQVGQLLLTAGLAALIFVGHVTIGHVLIASLLMGVTMALHVPARQALIPALVGKARLANALALHSISLNTSRILGPSLAGAVMGWGGVAGCLALQSVAYAWAVGNVLQIRYGTKTPPGREGRVGATVLHNLWEGFAYCYRTKAVFLQLLIAAIPTIVAYPYMQFLPSFARDYYKIGPSGLGVLMACMGVGALVGSFWIAARHEIRRKSLVTVACAAAFGLFLCGFAVAPWLPLALLCLVWEGASSAIYTTLNGIILQELCPDEYRGRVSSVYMVTWGLMPLGALPAGALAEVYGARFSVFLGGAICFTLALALLALAPQVRQAANGLEGPESP